MLSSQTIAALAPSTIPAVGTQRVRCTTIAPGLMAYVIEFENGTPYVRQRGVEDRFEVAVLLSGEAFYESPARGARQLASGAVYTYNPGEVHTDARVASDGRGVLVGFRVTEPECFGWSGDPTVPHPCIDAPRALEAARALYEAHRSDGRIDIAATVDAVSDVVTQLGTFSAPDPLERVRLLIESDPVAQLYQSHLAETAGMHSDTFTRTFRRRYHTTPIDYRLRVRLRNARQLLLARPDLTVTGVALHVGFESARFLRMALRSRGHASPQELRSMYAQTIDVPAPEALVRHLSLRVG